MNTLPEPVSPIDTPIPGTEFADRVIGGSKGMATKQASALLEKNAAMKLQLQTNTDDIDILNSNLVALTLALG